MRAGGYTVHQSLTAEAAAVLKLALGLARCRGHAQVTPLHVAFTLLGSSSSSYDLLRRACAKASAAQCRALELCFDVALKRLPSTTPVHQPAPTLSNALVAALKRAQASQRRGCVELQQTQQPPPAIAQQQQQPLLTIKVELDQLIVSILDDPSVSRVMREAGFSSAAVKTSLEEDSAVLLGLGLGSSSSSSSSASSPSMALPSQLWPQQFTHHPNNYAAFQSYQCKLEEEEEEEDVNAILEVMSRETKQHGARTNPAVVADCASAAEASVAELMRRLERGGGAVPDALRGAHVLRLHLSSVHVRLMARADVDAWAADLRRTVAACTNSTAAAAALLIYVGDMRWAVDDDADVRGPCGYSPAQHMAAALARLLGELRAAGRACWLVAAASYTTYMRCQRRGLDATWALQLVSVPGAAAGLSLGLALGPRAAASPKDGKVAKLGQFPLLESDHKMEHALCADCARNLESEASAARANAQGTNLALRCFPGWPQADEPQTSHTDDLTELKRKWSSLCQRVHLRHEQPARPSTAKCSDRVLRLSFETPTCHGTTGQSKINHQDVETTLSLVLPDPSQTSDGQVHRCSSEDLDGDRRRKAESGRPPSESKRLRGTGGLDLNLCAEEEEDGSEDEHVPSDLTNDGEGSSGGVTDSHN